MCQKGRRQNLSTNFQNTICPSDTRLTIQRLEGANSAAPDEVAHFEPHEPPDLDLHSLQIQIF